LHGADLDRFRALVRAKALVATFAAAAHLFAMRATPPTGEPKQLGDVPNDSTNDALGWFVSRLAGAVKGIADDGIDEIVARYAADAMDAVEADAHSAMGADIPAFEAAAYAVEADDFHLHGFARPGSAAKQRRVEIPFKKPHEVVGNHIAKAQALKLARMLVSYDFEARKNPFVDLGGFIFSFMGDGYPGTGKTTLIQMIAGLVNSYCEMAGYPFHFENFGIDQISEYQGKSGQNCKAFIERVLDPRAIAFGTVDDIDQVAGKRDDQRASGGQQEVTAVLMESLSGTGTVIRGNCAFGMFSNYPEKVDDALRQRAGARWLVDGPQTRDDYIDIFHLLIGKNHAIELGEHDLYAAQELKKMVAENYGRHSVPLEHGLRDVWDEVVAEIGTPDTIADIGDYLHRIKEREPRFTGRAIKN
ncbi:MAG: ATP-binding protein, partial [Hyphomicrobiales bacterium]|nr:ATP-binding protein [Hyphomicrobiales bacterium]